MGKATLKLTIFGGKDKEGNSETIRHIDIFSGEIIGIVGPTGSGKSTLINDIEQLANQDTFSRRKILLNGKSPSIEVRTDPKQKMIAQLSQNMHFLTDMGVKEFIELHAKSRNKNPKLSDKVIQLANKLCGEKIVPECPLTILSGGQSRALMIADIALISQSPIVLIDEIENAGIKKYEALEVLVKSGKIVILITHDPMLALMTDKRIFMANGAIKGIIKTTKQEKLLLKKLLTIDNDVLELRNLIRNGKGVDENNYSSWDTFGRKDLSAPLHAQRTQSAVC